MLLLAHVHKRGPVVITPTHDVSSRGEHALDLAILIAYQLVSSLCVYGLSLATQVVASSCLLLGTRLIELSTVVTPYALATSAEKPFHTVNISVILGSRLLCSSLLPVVNLTLVLL